MKKNKSRSIVWPLVVFFVMVLLDRITKLYALVALEYDSRVQQIFPGLSLHFAWNRGVSWGMFGQSSDVGFWVLTCLIGSIIVFFTIYTIGRYAKYEPIMFEVLVLTGAISNFFDRIYYGAVIDFIDCSVGSWHWPTFNVADACIVIGVGGLLYKLAFYKQL